MLGCVCGGVGEAAVYGLFALASMILVKFRERIFR